ncbi:MAG: redoxin domain-containing protein, partial [Opitutaceae bacterium]|nr:redoxin domain-containing protein [Opitutaceae bacterium]
MRIPQILRFVFLFGLVGGFCAAAEMPGLKVGDRAPEFTLASGTGSEISLADLRKNGPVILVFVRSADWCPHCRRQLQGLEADRAELEAHGAQLVALSYDSAATQAQAVAKLGLTYPLLADPGSKTIDAYGIRNHEARGKGLGVPHPAIFVVDRTGVIRAKLMEESYRDRPSSEAIQAALTN